MTNRPSAEDLKAALNALDWLPICLDMSHEEWCDSASWRDDFEAKCETIRTALTERLRNTPAKGKEVKVIEFGIGNLVITKGSYGDKPCVFIEQCRGSGQVGDKVASEHRTPENAIEQGLVLTFPTEEQAKWVDNCLVNKLPAPVENSGPVDDKAGMKMVSNEWLRKRIENDPDLPCEAGADLVQPSSEGVKEALQWMEDREWEYPEGSTSGRVVRLIKSALSNSVPDGENSDVVRDTFTPTHRHRKRGTLYQLIGDAVMQCEEEVFDNKRLTLYRGEDGKYWVRPPSEFNDGRFAAHEKESKA